MGTEVILVRDGAGYRVVFGYLRLAVALMNSAQSKVEIKGVGTGVVTVTGEGMQVKVDGSQFPLFNDWGW